MFWIGLAYLVIGFISGVWILLTQLDEIKSVFEVVVCLIVNVLFWPLVWILAFAAGKMFKGMGGN